MTTSISRKLLTIIGAATVLAASAGVEAGEQAAAPTPLVYNWQVDERPYEQAPWYSKAGRNLRDGSVGLVDNAVQGATSMLVLVWQTGLVTQKAATLTGDIVALVDNNHYSQHVFAGVVSRHLLRFGARSRGIDNALSGIHDRRFSAPELPISAYVGKQTFHSEAYVWPSAIALVGACVAADFLIRPAGNLLTIFGARDLGNQLDETGLELIDAAFDVRFL